jgi:hypothetical protein
MNRWIAPTLISILTAGILLAVSLSGSSAQMQPQPVDNQPDMHRTSTATPSPTPTATPTATHTATPTVTPTATSTSTTTGGFTVKFNLRRVTFDAHWTQEQGSGGCVNYTATAQAVVTVIETDGTEEQFSFPTGTKVIVCSNNVHIPAR